MSKICIWSKINYSDDGFHLQNGASDDQTKEEVREKLESGPFEIEGEEKKQAGSE